MSLPMPYTTQQQPAFDPRQLQAMDAPLVALTQQCKGDLRQLMHAFFSFLNRRTDFYLVPHPGDVNESGPKKKTMGFSEGDAEKMLIAAFRQFPLRRIPKGGVPVPAREKGGKGSSASATKEKTSPTTNPTTKKKDSSTGGETGDTEAKVVEISTNSSGSKDKPSVSKEETTLIEDNTDGTTAEGSNKIPSNMKGIRYNEEGLQIPIGNGGSTPRYKWTQTIDETTVLIAVPKTFRGKDYDVSINSSKLSVKAKKCLPGETKPRTFVEGKLVGSIRADESTWSVEGGVLIATLEKKEKRFWETVYESDLESKSYTIDTELVDSRRRIDEYDDATQAQFRKCIFDQNQYHIDGPTADEILGKAKAGSSIPGLPPGVQYKDKKVLDTSNTTDIPELPAGVEFIDKKTLDNADATKGKK